MNNCGDHNIAKIADLIREIKGFPFEIHSIKKGNKYKFEVKLGRKKVATFNISCESSCCEMKEYIITRIRSTKRKRNCPNSDILTTIEQELLKN